MNTKFKIFISSYWVLLLIICLKMILQFVVVNPAYELHRDEFLYLNQADHLAFGYICVPPLTALFSKIIYLFGGSMFWIRLFPAAFGALTIVFTWLIAGSVGGSTIAKILAASAMLFSPLIRINILFQPNSFDILTWTIIFYLLIRFFQSEKPGWLYLLSVIIALGFYNKYNLVFLIAGLVPGLLLTKERVLFKNPVFWKALFICLLLLSPNIIWQATNHFPVFQHMKVLRHNQLANNSSGGFLISQIMFFFGSLPVWISAIAAFFIFKSFKPYRFIGITFIALIALFAIMKAKNYYSVGIYPVMIAIGSVYIDSVLSKNWSRIVLPVLLTFNVAVFFLTLKVIYPVYSPAQIREHAGSFEKLGMLRWEDGKNHDLPQDFADMLGWSEMAEKALAAYKMIPETELDSTLVICGNYGEAGALNYFNRKKMPEAYAFNTDYIYWLPHLKRIENILLIADKPPDELRRAFKECKLSGVVENQYAREHNIGIYLLTGANPLFTAVFYSKVAEKKKNLDIF